MHPDDGRELMCYTRVFQWYLLVFPCSRVKVPTSYGNAVKISVFRAIKNADLGHSIK